MDEVIINGFSNKSIPFCQLIDADEVKASLIRYTENPTIYGANGRLNLFDGAYDGYERSLTFLVKHLEDIARLVGFFLAEDNVLEFSYQKGSLFYGDFLASSYKPFGPHYWKVDISLYMQPFRYQKEVEDIVLGSSGALINPGTVYAEPLVIIEGQGEVSLTIGSQIMRLNLDTKASIDCRHLKQKILDKNGAIKNTIRKSGPFFELPVGRSGVTSTGNVTKITIKGNWRYKV